LLRHSQLVQHRKSHSVATKSPTDLWSGNHLENTKQRKYSRNPTAEISIGGGAEKRKKQEYAQQSITE